MTDEVLTRVVGCPHMGRSVELACRALRDGDGLICVREPNNPHDANAVVLLNITGTPVGYVQRAVAGQVAAWIDEGRAVGAKVTEPSRVWRRRRRGRTVLANVTYPWAVIWADDPPAESFESEDAVEMEKERILERTA